MMGDGLLHGDGDTPPKIVVKFAIDEMIPYMEALFTGLPAKDALYHQIHDYRSSSGQRFCFTLSSGCVLPSLV
jgi:exonuclease V gamma subunit